MSLINLLPDDYLRRQVQKRTNRLCMILFGVVMAAVLTAAGISEKSYRNTREVCQRVNDSYAEAEKNIQQLQELEVIRSKMYDKATRTSSLLEKMPRSNIVAALTNALPEGASLVKVELKVTRGAVITSKVINKYEAEKAKAAAAAGKDQPKVVTLTVTGMAHTDVEVARFITCMAQCPMVDTPDLVYSQEKKISDVTVREFQVVMRVRLEPEAARGPTALVSTAMGGAS
jgi:Tfp pilus assembly protein PilN